MGGWEVERDAVNCDDQSGRHTKKKQLVPVSSIQKYSH
jgi:hypothetical protein